MPVHFKKKPLLKPGTAITDDVFYKLKGLGVDTLTHEAGPYGKYLTVKMKDGGHIKIDEGLVPDVEKTVLHLVKKYVQKKYGKDEIGNLDMDSALIENMMLAEKKGMDTSTFPPLKFIPPEQVKETKKPKVGLKIKAKENLPLKGEGHLSLNSDGVLLGITSIKPNLIQNLSMKVASGKGGVYFHGDGNVTIGEAYIPAEMVWNAMGGKGPAPEVGDILQVAKQMDIDLTQAALQVANQAKELGKLEARVAELEALLTDLANDSATLSSQICAHDTEISNQKTQMNLHGAQIDVLKDSHMKVSKLFSAKHDQLETKYTQLESKFEIVADTFKIEDKK